MEELLNYYKNLLIIQYHGGLKAKATIDMLVKLCWANFILRQIRDAFEVETAVGKQLDIIGMWVGVDRTTNKKPYDDHPWIALIESTGATSEWQGGFSEPANFNTRLGGFLTSYYASGKVAYQLNDEAFRWLIKMKIIKNSISHTCKNIDDAIYQFSNGEMNTRWDISNRTVHYEYERTYRYNNLMPVAYKKNIIPCPTGYKIEWGVRSST